MIQAILRVLLGTFVYLTAHSLATTTPASVLERRDAAPRWERGVSPTALTSLIE